MYPLLSSVANRAKKAAGFPIERKLYLDSLCVDSGVAARAIFRTRLAQDITIILNLSYDH